MNEIEVIEVSKLKPHQKSSELIPEMYKEEWKDFIKDVKENGIREPLYINQHNEVLDGRHRLKAAKELNITEVKVKRGTYTEQEAVQFAVDTAINRRNISVEQRLHILLEMDDFIKELHKKGVAKRELNLKKGKDSPKVSDELIGKTKDTNQQIADMAGSSRAQVGRIKRIKRESPELYKQVVEGEKSIAAANRELGKGFDPGAETKKKQKRGDANVTTTTKPQNKELTKEEKEKAMFNANVQTLFMHLNEIEGFIGRTEKIKEVVKEAKKKDEASLSDYKESLKKLIKFMEE